jgi:hypothetical protein
LREEANRGRILSHTPTGGVPTGERASVRWQTESTHLYFRRYFRC